VVPAVLESRNGMIVKGERLKRTILAALADIESQKILDATMYQPKSVNQIIQESNLSHSTVYRKIRWLVKEKLLIVDKIEITETGKKTKLFRSILKSFRVNYGHNNVVIQAEQNSDTLRKITENFFTLPDSG
jgi:DNA-binding transcriptional ArsR family regulator